MKRITIKDLAKMLDLSVSTISRALNDHPDISEETRLRVKETARAFNYRTNLQARFFRKKHSGLLALILPEINMFYVPSLIEGINHAIAESAYSLVMFQSDNNIEKEKEIIEQCISWAVEGVMISVSSDTSQQNIQHLDELEYANIKCLQFDRIIPQTGYASLTIDNSATAEKAVRHLIDNGHRKVLGIFGHDELHITKERKTGFDAAFNALGIPANHQKMISGVNPSELNKTLPSLIRKNEHTALFAMTDEALYYASNSIRRLNIRIPEELSIIAISDGIFTKQFFPQITHVEDSGLRMGRAIVDKIIRMINNEETDLKSEIQTKLIDLGSVKRI